MFGKKESKPEMVDPAAAAARAARWKNGVPAGARVLICDDAPIIRMIERDALDKAGCKVVGEAGNGEVAVRFYKELLPDITLMDYVMPHLNGLDAMKQIRQYDPSAVVVMVAEPSEEGFVAECFQAGACEYLPKPFKPERLKETVELAIKDAGQTYASV